MKVTLLSETEIRGCAGFDREALEAVELGFTRLAQGRAFAPPVIAIEIPEHNGEVDIKTAYIEGLDSFAVKVASGFSDNPARGLPYGTGMMVLISAETGFLQALLVDNGYLTELRTGLAGAIAADQLARPDIVTAGVIGSGSQARYQMRGLKMVRDFKRLVVYGIIPDEVAHLRRRHRSRAGRPRHRGHDARAGGARKRRRGQHHAGARAVPRSDVAAPRPARHLHGVGHADQAGAYADCFAKADRRGLRQARAVPGHRRAASCRRRRADRRAGGDGARRDHGRRSSRAVAATTRSRSAT